jgi:hypothetical protein
VLDTKVCAWVRFVIRALPASRRLLLCASLVSSYPAYAWWETGHKAIARVAAAHLTTAARTRLARILGVPDTAPAVADALAVISNWADETRAQTNTGEWHYIDLALQDRKSDIPARCQHDNCAPARIHLFAIQLSSSVVDHRYSELDSLRYLVHFVGDIHQPLHTISDADLGGNCERLDPPIDTAQNLHALWDGAIVNEINSDDKALASDLDREIHRFSAFHRRRLSNGNERDWVWQSHELAIRAIYERLHIPVEPIEFPHACKDAPKAITDFRPQVDREYIDNMKPVVRLQLIKAGLRLAHLLNESL